MAYRTGHTVSTMLAGSWVLVCLCVWIVSLDTAFGYCFKDPIKFERTVSGRVRKYCEYKHPPVVNKNAGYIVMFPDSSVFTGDCLACTCTMGGLTCCGFGHQEVNFILPSDCVQLQDGCHGLHVKRRNNSLDCFTGKPINFDKLSPHPDNVFSLPSLVEPGSTKVIQVTDKPTSIPTETPTKMPIVVTTNRPIRITRPVTQQPSKHVRHHVHSIKNEPNSFEKHKHTGPSHQIQHPEVIPVLNTAKLVSKAVTIPTPTVALGNIPVLPKSNTENIIPNLISSIKKEINNTISLNVPRKVPVQSPQTVISPPKREQMKPLPLFNFNRNPRFKPITVPNSYTQNAPRMLNWGFQPYPLPTAYPVQRTSVVTQIPPFYPVPYIDPVRDTREDSSSSGAPFNDFLFRMMMFGAFS